MTTLRQLRAEILITPDGNISFHGNDQEIIARLYERKIEEAKAEGKRELLMNVIDGFGNLAKK